MLFPPGGLLVAEGGRVQLTRERQSQEQWEGGRANSDLQSEPGDQSSTTACSSSKRDPPSMTGGAEVW